MASILMTAGPYQAFIVFSDNRIDFYEKLTFPKFEFINLISNTIANKIISTNCDSQNKINYLKNLNFLR